MPTSADVGGGAGGFPTSALETPGASALRLRPVTKVWGRPKPGQQLNTAGSPSNTAPATGAAPAGANATAAAPAPAPASLQLGSSHGKRGGGQGYSGQQPDDQEQDPQKAAQLAERQRMAAMLFEGVTTSFNPAGVRAGAGAKVGVGSGRRPGGSGGSINPQAPGRSGGPGAPPVASSPTTRPAVAGTGAIGVGGKHGDGALIDLMSLSLDGAGARGGAVEGTTEGNMDLLSTPPQSSVAVSLSSGGGGS
ncbi:unnamed protein product, partial [Discosporangium mesarthrocarpum]